MLPETLTSCFSSFVIKAQKMQQLWPNDKAGIDNCRQIISYWTNSEKGRGRFLDAQDGNGSSCRLNLPLNVSLFCVGAPRDTARKVRVKSNL